MYQLVLLFIFATGLKSQNITVSNNNIAFELPDLTKIISTETGEFQIEAFKSVLNDQIIRDNNAAKHSQLFWVSLGNVKFLTTNKNGSNVIFHSQPDGYYALIQTLTEQQREILAETARSKYSINVTKWQIVNLILSKFSCVINLFNKFGEKKIVTGEVRNFHNYPLRMDFWMPLGSKERFLFEQRLEMMKNDKNVDMQLMCSIASSGQQIKTNTLTISAQLSEQLGIVDKLFGASSTADSSVYVTREQLASLAADIYSSLSVIEEYQIPESQFSETFVQEFVKQVSLRQFQTVSFDQSLEKLSKYTADFSADLKPDEIKKDVGQILGIKKTNNKSHIITNDEFLEKLIESGKIDAKHGGSFSFAKLFKVGGSVGYTRDHTRDWLESGKSLDDQLRELNSETTDDIKWQIEGTKIVPKSLTVAQIVRGSFQKTLVFQRVRRQFTDAPFHRDVAVYTSQALGGSDKFEEIKSMLSAQDNVLKAVQAEIATLKSVTNDINGKLNNANTKIANAEAVVTQTQTVVNQKGTEITQLQTTLNNLNTQLVQFTGSNHCILANGNCPVGYPYRYNAYMKAIRMFASNTNYIKPENFGSSFIRCHGTCGQYGEWVGEIELVTCCK